MNRPMRLALAATACALLAACSLDNQTMGPQNPVASTQFAVTANIGTSLSAGFESGGINDSTQREGPMYQLAKAMGLTPGVDWFYPSFAGFGCPAPLTNPLNGARVGGATAAACGLRAPSSAALNMSNTGIPGLRAVQALNVDTVPYAVSDVLQLAQFITGGVSPVTMVLRQHPTFVTVEVGANDVLAAATRGDTTILTPAANFTTYIGAIADSLDSLNPKPGVAIATVPNVTVIPHFQLGLIYFCLKNGGCPPPLPGATPPFNSAGFTVDATCAPSASGGVGDSMLVTFSALGQILFALTKGHAATLNCGVGTVVADTATGAVPKLATFNVLSKASVLTVVARVAAFNAAIQALATARGYAYVDLNTPLAAQVAAGNIPAFPSLATPLSLFGTLFSQDGVHPTKAGYKILAQAFATAINAKYGSALVIP